MRADGPAQDYSTGQGFGLPEDYNADPGYPRAQGYRAGPDFGAAQDYNTGRQYQPGPGFAQPQGFDRGRQYQPGPGYGDGQDYDTGASFGAAQDYNTGQQYQPGPGSPQAQGFDRSRARAARPQQAAGYPQAGGYPASPGAGRPGPQGARGNRRLYAVPDAGPQGIGPRGPQGMGPRGPHGMGPGGGQMVQYGGGQAVALADPAWQDDLQEFPETMAAPAFAPPRPRTRPNGPAARPVRPARPASLAGPPAPKTAPSKKPQGARGRQYNAWRIAASATAVLFAVTVLAAGTEIAHYGLKFFTFRASGVGETGGSSTDQSFLAQRAKAANGATQTHTPGKHSAKTTSK